jgi:hypothetical protein
MPRNPAEREHNPIFISHIFLHILYSQRQFLLQPMGCRIWLFIPEKNP